MEIQFFEDIARFDTLVSPFLLQNEAKNNLMLALLNGLSKDPLRYGAPPILVGGVENDKIVFAGMRTPPHNQILAFTENLDYVEQCATFLHENGQKIPGILGFKAGALKFAQKWEQLTHIPFQLEMHERIYELLEVNPATIGDRKFRQVSLQDLDIIAKWSRAMQLEALGSTNLDNEATIKEELLQNDLWKTFYVLCQEDVVVTMAKQSGITPTGQIVNFVYTPPEFRRKGYATECVAKLSQLSLNEGKQRCLLFTDLNNPTSNKIYQKIGYRPIIDIDVYKFG